MSNQPIIKIFDILYSEYGQQGWWPGESQFEIILGAILTQNTAWHNVALAIANLKKENLLDPDALLDEKPEHVKTLIAPAGFFNIKYKRLKNILEYLMKHNINFDRFRYLPIVDLRNELLEVNGVGP